MKNSFNSKGVSQIIATVIMIALVFAVAAIVFGVITNLVDEQIEGSESCFGNFGKVTIDKRFTCYNDSSNELTFLVEVGGIDIDGILTSVSGKSGAISFEIKNNTLSFVKTYNGVYGEVLNSPGKNSGKTYIVNLDEISVQDVEVIKTPCLGTKVILVAVIRGLCFCKPVFLQPVFHLRNLPFKIHIASAPDATLRRAASLLNSLENRKISVSIPGSSYNA